jgi:cytochrome c-type biogenesis protein CcmH
MEAQTGEALNRDAREIFETVLSPYCPGRTISNCPSPQADELRANIKQQLASGETPADIKEELYAVFGEELRTVPRAQGIGLLAWIVPGLGFLFGGLAIVTWMRRTRIHQDGAAVSTPLKLDPDADARLQAEMAELESLH